MKLVSVLKPLSLLFGLSLFLPCNLALGQGVPDRGYLSGLWAWNWTPEEEADGPDNRGAMAINDSGVVVGTGFAYSVVNSPSGGTYLPSQDGPWYQHTDLTSRMMEPRNYLAGYPASEANAIQTVAYYQPHHPNQFNLPYPPIAVCEASLPTQICFSSEEQLRRRLYIGGAFSINNSGRVVGYIGDRVPSGWGEAGSPWQPLYEYYYENFAINQTAATSWTGLMQTVQAQPRWYFDRALSSRRSVFRAVNDSDFAVGWEENTTSGATTARIQRFPSATRVELGANITGSGISAIKPRAISTEISSGSYGNRMFVAGQATFTTAGLRRAFACAITDKNLGANFCPLQNLGVLGTDSSLKISEARDVEVPFCPNQPAVLVGTSQDSLTAPKRGFACTLSTTSTCTQKRELPPFSSVFPYSNGAVNPNKFSEARAVNRHGVIVGRAAREVYGGSGVTLYGALWTKSTSASSGYQVYDLLTNNNIVVPCAAGFCPASTVWERLVALTAINNRNDIVGIGKKIGFPSYYAFVIRADRPPLQGCVVPVDECLIKVRRIATGIWTPMATKLAAILGVRDVSQLPLLPLSAEALRAAGFTERDRPEIVRSLLEAVGIQVPVSEVSNVTNLTQTYLFALFKTAGGDTRLQLLMTFFGKSLDYLVQKMNLSPDQIDMLLPDPFDPKVWNRLSTGPLPRGAVPIVKLAEFFQSWTIYNQVRTSNSQVLAVNDYPSIWTVNEALLPVQHVCPIMRIQ